MSFARTTEGLREYRGGGPTGRVFLNTETYECFNEGLVLLDASDFQVAEDLGWILINGIRFDKVE